MDQRPSCDDARALLADLLDRGLEPEQRRLLDAHVSHCDGCSATMDEQRGLDALLASMTAPPPSAGFGERVIHALDRAPAGRRPAPLPSPARLRTALSSALALAAVAVAAAVFVPDTATASALEVIAPGESLASVPSVTMEGVRETASSHLESVASFVPSGVALAAAAVAAMALVTQVLWFRLRSPEDSR